MPAPGFAFRIFNWFAVFIALVMAFASYLITFWIVGTGMLGLFMLEEQNGANKKTTEH